MTALNLYSDISQGIDEVVAEALEETQLLHDNPEAAGLTTGLKALDRHARYAFAPGGLVLLGGETGSGKTALANQLGLSFAAQVPTLLVTLEDDARDTVKRTIANVGRLNVGAIRSGFPDSHIPPGFLEAAELVSKQQLRTIDRLNLNVLDMAKAIGAWWLVRGKQFGVVLIDQLSLIAPVGSDQETVDRCVRNRWPAPPGAPAKETVQLEWTVRILRMVARQLGICIVVLSQLNEEHAEGEKPTMRSFRNSRGIVHESTLALVSWVPKRIKVENPGPGEEKTRANLDGEGWILCLKGRRTQIFEEQVKFIGQYQAFVDPGNEVARYVLPTPRSQAAIEGLARLTALSQRFDSEHLKKIQAAATPAIVTAQRKQLEASDDQAPVDEDQADWSEL